MTSTSPGGDPHFADEGVEQYVAAASMGGPLTESDVAGLRAGAAQRARQRPPGPDLVEVRDLQVADRPARLFRPFAGPRGAVVLWLHGGGWTFGGADTHDRMGRRLAATSGAAVLVLDYRLAPEHPWPAAVDDTVAALQWLAASPTELGFAVSHVVVGGDSAGGALAALSCLRLRDAGSAALPDLAVLVYGNTDLSCDRPSMHENAVGRGLDPETVRFFNRLWVPDPSRWRDPRVSPLWAADLSGLPETLVVTAEHDVLRDQGEVFARRLQEAGVPTGYRCEAGLIHNFLLIDLLSPAAAAAADRVARDIGGWLADHDHRAAR